MSSVLVCSYWSVPLFLFFTQKTAYEMRISDWSSDVCASDLIAVALSDRSGADRAEIGARLRLGQVHRAGPPALDERRQIDAPDRKSVVEGQSVSVRLDLGGRRIITKKQQPCRT